MMKILWDSYPLKTDNKNKGLINTARFCTPVLFCGTLLIVISYISNLIYTKSAVLNLGETTSVTSAIYSIGSLICKLSLPLISTVIALSTGGIYALPSGIVGGILSVSGGTAQNIAGSISGASGVLGCVVAGYLSGYTTKLCFRLFSKNDNDTPLEIIYPAVSLLLTVFTVFAINNISAYIYSVSSEVLALTGEKGSILLPLLLGIYLTADPGGSLFLSAYIFGASSVATNQPQVMAAVVAAGMIPSLSIGLFAYIFKERLEPFERITAYFGILSSLTGISQLAYPIYISRLYKLIIPCIPGGCISALLTVLFKCSTNHPMGGLLTFSSEGKPLFFLVAVICGVVVSTALLTLTIKPISEKEKTENTENSVVDTAKA